jgi:hypothetical protein
MDAVAPGTAPVAGGGGDGGVADDAGDGAGDGVPDAEAAVESAAPLGWTPIAPAESSPDPPHPIVVVSMAATAPARIPFARILLLPSALVGERQSFARGT